MSDLDHRASTALARATVKLATGFAADVAAHQEVYEDWGLDEREEQVHIDLAGKAAVGNTWVLSDVDFQHSFTGESGRRMSQLDRPHTWFGGEARKASVDGQAITPLLTITAAVIGWTIQGGSAITGCKLAICITSAIACDFQAVLHATFQGFGVPRDPTSEETE